MSFKASAPGSLMLLGEHGVLYGKHALVCAIDKRMTVTLTPRSDTKIEIHSEALGSYATDLYELQIEKPFQFVLGALKHYQVKLKRGCNIEIVSEFSDKVGFGSSAAVTVATLATLVTWLNIRVSPIDLIRQGRNVVRQVQGLGSGADVAASVYGGLVGYQAQPLLAEKFSLTHPITALYAGFKTPTVDVIKKVQEHFANYPQLLRQIHNAIGQCAADGIQHVRREDWVRLGEVMNIQQGLMESLGVSTLLMHDMVHDLRKQKGVLGAKISGSGLGDCIVGLGKVSDNYSYYIGEHHHGIKRIPVGMTLQGVHCEKI